MRLPGFLLTILFAFLLAGTSQAFVGPTCLKIKEELGNRPDIILQKFKKEVCDKGCKPVISHYNKWARTNAVEPFFSEVMKKMGMPDKTPIMTKLADDFYKITKKDCAKFIGKGDFCRNPETLHKFGNCLKGSLVPAVMSRIGDLLPMVDEKSCKKEFNYLLSSSLWENDIPKYFKKYAKVCKKLK